MFNLDKAIAEWRQQMLKAGLKSPVPLDELETHLRDDIQAQTPSGLDPQQAFDAAVLRIGQAGALKAEFEIASKARKSRELKLMGAIIVGAACFYTLFVAVCVLFKLGSCSDFTFNEQMSALVAGVLTALLLIGGRFGHRFFPVVSDKRTRMGIVAASFGLFFGWLCIYFYLVMTRFEFDMSQLVVSLLWALSPWGALLGFIYGLERAALHKAGLGRVTPLQARVSS
jgi:hypothetical protein